jgi:hypothetical protein
MIKARLSTQLEVNAAISHEYPSPAFTLDFMKINHMLISLKFIENYIKDVLSTATIGITYF